MSDFPEYFGVLPASVRYDRCLSPGAKVLYADIGALCRLNGVCWATNGYFAKLYDVSETCVSLWVSQLTKAGYVVPEEAVSLPGNRQDTFKKSQNRRLKIVKEGVQKKLKQNNTVTQGNKTDTQGNISAPHKNESLLDRLLQASFEQTAVSLTPWEASDTKTSESQTVARVAACSDVFVPDDEACAVKPIEEGASGASAPNRTAFGTSQPETVSHICFTAEATMPDSLARRAFKACFGWEWGDLRVHPAATESPAFQPIRAVVSWAEESPVPRETPKPGCLQKAHRNAPVQSATHPNQAAMSAVIGDSQTPVSERGALSFDGGKKRAGICLSNRAKTPQTPAFVVKTPQNRRRVSRAKTREKTPCRAGIAAGGDALRVAKTREKTPCRAGVSVLSVPKGGHACSL